MNLKDHRRMRIMKKRNSMRELLGLENSLLMNAIKVWIKFLLF